MHACRDLKVIERYSTLLKDKVILLPTSNDLSAGFAYYLCEIVVPELLKCQDQPPGNDALRSILDPFVQGMVQTENSILLKKIDQDVFEAIAQELETVPFSSLDVISMAETIFTLGMCILPPFFFVLPHVLACFLDTRKLSAYTL